MQKQNSKINERCVFLYYIFPDFILQHSIIERGIEWSSKNFKAFFRCIPLHINFLNFPNFLFYYSTCYLCAGFF